MSLAWEADDCCVAISWFNIDYFGAIHEDGCPAIVVECLAVIMITLREYNTSLIVPEYSSSRVQGTFTTKFSKNLLYLYYNPPNACPNRLPF